jgi:hypothetical protein
VEFQKLHNHVPSGLQGIRNTKISKQFAGTGILFYKDGNYNNTSTTMPSMEA